MTARVLGRKREYGGLRPTEPARDLGQVTALLEKAFAREELSKEGRQALSELRFLSHLSPLVWLLDRIDMEFHEFCRGFVWVEGGRVVGNVNISKAGPGYWSLSNLAVAPSYRGQGIGRRLTEAALDLVCRRGGRTIVLRVRATNEIALDLYRSLGFEKVSATTEMRLEGIRRVDFVPAEGFSLRPRSHDDWETEYKLALAVTPAKAQELKPVRESDFRIGLDQKLGNFLTGRREHHLAVEKDEDFIAALTVRATRFWGEHSLKMMVHPDYRGLLEKMLVTKALSILAKYPQRSVVIKHPASHQEAIQVLREYGFEEERTLVRMRLEL